MNLVIVLAAVFGILTPTQAVAQAETKPEIALVAEYAPETQEINDSKTIEQKIRERARHYGYDENRAVRIAKAESNLDQEARNKESTASGICIS